MSELRVESRLTAGTHSTYDLLTLLANEFRATQFLHDRRFKRRQTTVIASSCELKLMPHRINELLLTSSASMLISRTPLTTSTLPFTFSLTTKIDLLD